VVQWSVGILEHGVPGSKERHIERVSGGIQEPHMIVFSDVVVEGLGEEGQLFSVGSLDGVHL